MIGGGAIEIALTDAMNQLLSGTEIGIVQFYGNPIAEHVRLMQDCPLLRGALTRGLLDDYLQRGPGPRPDERVLQSMVSQMQRVPSNVLSYIEACEEDHFSVMAQHLQALGLKNCGREDLEEMIRPYAGILMFSKYYFNVPRPWTLAWEMSIPLYPLVATDASSPATPGGHAFDAYVIAYKLSKKHPEMSNALWRIAYAIGQTRVLAGLHYPSDNENAFELLLCLINRKLI